MEEITTFDYLKWALQKEGALDTTEPQERIATSRPPKRDEWITRDGRILRVKDMDNNHIQNCINLLKRKIAEWANGSLDSKRIVQAQVDSWSVWIDRFEAELEKRLGTRVSTPAPIIDTNEDEPERDLIL
jgi:hypothetical protein